MSIPTRAVAFGSILLVVSAIVALRLPSAFSDEGPSSGAASSAAPATEAVARPPQSSIAPPTTDEARERARLLWETVHATLHVVHLHYYREDEGLTIPGVAMKSVFRELAQRRRVQLRWLAVNAQAMNVEHEPQDDFERSAVKALAGGANEDERGENGRYRYVAAITMGSECLKCHLPRRTSTDARLGGLVMSMPVR